MFKLLRYFSIVSAALLLVTTVLLANIYRQVTVAQIVDHGGIANTSLAGALANAVWPGVADHVAGAAGLSGDELRAHPETARLQEVVRRHLRGLSVIKVKIYDTHGLTVFSTQASQMGDDKSENPGFLSARAGKVASDLTHRDTFSAFEGEIEDRDVLASYIPIRNQRGEIQGVFEIYDDVTPLVSKIERTEIYVIVGTIALFVFLYLAFFLIVYRADRILKSQHGDILGKQEELAENNKKLALEMEERRRAEEALQTLNEDLERRVDARTIELRAAQEELIRNERLAVLGQLIGTVSHELRNPLSTLNSALFLVEAKMKRQEFDFEPVVERASRSVARCEEIIAEMLDFARTSELAAESVTLDQWLEEVLKEQNIPEAVTLSRKFSLKDLKVRIDRSRLRRVIINVIDNACQAMLPETGSAQASSDPSLSVDTAMNEERIEIIIADNGPGMDSETLEKIFQPLFSTKSKGTGLGMPTVEQIMERHGGGVEVDSSPGAGTKITLWLPLSARSKRKDEMAA
jgi:signal transduction histidine kinase